MHFSSTFVAVAALALGVRADLSIDLEDTPRECRDICRPIDQLHRDCEVDLRDDQDREEDQLEAQCFCTNESFEVAQVSAHCHDCIRQAIQKARDNKSNGKDDNNRDFDDDGDDDDDDDGDDLWEGDDGDQYEDWRDAQNDMSEILRSCGFETTSYTADATSLVGGITVSAARPTDASQLTTTFTRGPEPTGGNGSGGGSGSGNNDDNNDNSDDNNDNNDNNDDSNNDSGNGGSSDNSNESNNSDNSDDNSDDNNDNAAGVLSPVYFAGAIVAGAMAFA